MTKMIFVNMPVRDLAKSMAFYEALGFAVVRRSPVDDMGLPFPILHMRREAPTDAA